MKELSIPTHMRFIFKCDAQDWDTVTTMFHKIDEIQVSKTGWAIKTKSFAWVDVAPKTLNRFEFKTEF